MKVLTLRAANTLPEAYAGAAEFFVRIAGKKTLCKTLADAQRATAYFPQGVTVTFMSAETDAIKSIMPADYRASGFRG